MPLSNTGKIMKRILFAALAMFMLAGSTHAAEISCDNDSFFTLNGRASCGNGHLNGEIVKGDYEKVESLIGLGAAHFSLASPGGDVDEALKIGRLFRKYLIETSAPYRYPDDSPRPSGCLGENICCFRGKKIYYGQNCTCASACALIWFGGVDRGGTVGLHRPYINDPIFRGLPPADASTAYRQMLDNVVAYLNEMEVPRSIIESMVATSSGDIRWIDADLTEGLDRPPSIAEWVDASCGSFDFHEALRQNHNKELSPQQWDALHRMSQQKLQCALALFDKYRERPDPRPTSELKSDRLTGVPVRR
jgi:hypothetical protein